MLTSDLRRFLLCTISAGLLLLSGAAFAAASTPPPPPPQNVHFEIGAWRVAFDPAASSLECALPSSGICLRGPLSFSTVRNGKPVQWRVLASRDPLPGRLALVDDKNEVQGYLALTGDALRLSLTLVSRPRWILPGELRFAPVAQLAGSAFACRTRFSGSQVVQLASGPADSGLNDSLFIPERDQLLQLTGARVAIATVPSSATGAANFRLDLAAQLGEPNTTTITIELLPSYYRSRYVPYFRLIDRTRCPSAPTGWMAWNAYFDAATEDDNLNEARVAAKALKPFGLEIWSIESWQENSPKLPVQNFHHLNLRSSKEKFPHGMKWMAEQIRSLGFRPGIWTVSFGTGDAEFYKAHREWFLHHPDGRPMSNWNGRFVLDPSQPAVLEFTRESHRKMAEEWGYDFFKCDGMSGASSSLSAHFFEKPEVRAAFRHPCEDPYGRWVETLRQGIGPNRVLLACQGHYTGPDVAWCDAARIGSDIVTFPKPPDWSKYRLQAQMTQRQIFVNNIVWFNDPDTAMVGEYAPIESARIAATVVALPGQLTFFGDKLSQLPAERMKLLQQMLPVCDVRPLDLAPLAELKPIWDLKLRRPFGAWDVVSVFNWEDQPRTMRLAFADLGLDDQADYLVFDFWNQRFLGAQSQAVELQVAPHSNQLLAVHKRLEIPQFLSTNRHLSQGGVELVDSRWNAQDAELTCTFKLVGNDTLKASFHVPEAFAVATATAKDATVTTEPTTNPRLLSVGLRRDTSGEAQLRLRFRAQAARN